MAICRTCNIRVDTPRAISKHAAKGHTVIFPCVRCGAYGQHDKATCRAALATRKALRMLAE